jgi:hypothetical protein
MNIYGPSAATGLTAGAIAGVSAFTGNLMTGVFFALAAFALLSAAGATLRFLPKIRLRHNA